MRVSEFVEAVRSYGVSPILTNTYSLGDYYEGLLELEHPGSGQMRIYTARHIRRLVAWLLLGQMVGSKSRSNTRGQAAQRRQAMRLIAAASEGWVILADGRAWWSLAMPVATLRSRCAVAIPVPAWRH